MNEQDTNCPLTIESVPPRSQRSDDPMMIPPDTKWKGALARLAKERWQEINDPGCIAFPLGKYAVHIDSCNGPKRWISVWDEHGKRITATSA